MAHHMSKLRELEGQQVCVALADGSRIDDCSLVSVPRRDVATVWVFNNGRDTFIPISEVVDVWQPVPRLRVRAA